MCGIFSLELKKEVNINLIDLLDDLIRTCAKRGRDSFGLVIVGEKTFFEYKSLKDPLALIEDKEFLSLIEEKIKISQKENEQTLLLGQCRLATSSSSVEEKNNQPLISEDIILLHNGILISNENNSHMNDSWDLLKIISNKSIENLQKNIVGENSFIAFKKAEKKKLWYTNNGSLYEYNKNDLHILCSEPIQSFECIQVEKCKVYKKSFGWCSPNLMNLNWRKKLKRCNRCVLPETHPFITFNKDGVCNYCIDYKNQKFLGSENLQRRLDKYRKSNGEADCIVGLSGGRDSCYGLHILKEKFGMNPLAYTYDWGLTTPISRRNQSRMCGALGVEHLIRSADLEKKRRYVRKNVNAWLRNPKLGMVPLFMAGDKEFYEYGRNLQKERNIDLTVFCSGQQVEQREFMVGFTGIKQPTLHNNPDMYHHPKIVKLKLAFWYSLQYLINPAYLNESFWDSINSFLISFLKSTNFIYLFHYLPWDENEIESLLVSKYGWEKDRNFGQNQWRMGDGQTAFTNFIYYHLAGLTEFDSYRSHQIREGYISRDEALRLLENEVEPRYDSVKEFCYTIGIPFEETIKRIKQIKPIYKI